MPEILTPDLHSATGQSKSRARSGSGVTQASRQAAQLRSSEVVITDSGLCMPLRTSLCMVFMVVAAAQAKGSAQPESRVRKASRLPHATARAPSVGASPTVRPAAFQVLPEGLSKTQRVHTSSATVRSVLL